MAGAGARPQPESPHGANKVINQQPGPTRGAGRAGRELLAGRPLSLLKSTGIKPRHHARHHSFTSNNTASPRNRIFPCREQRFIGLLDRRNRPVFLYSFLYRFAGPPTSPFPGPLTPLDGIFGYDGGCDLKPLGFRQHCRGRRKEVRGGADKISFEPGGLEPLCYGMEVRCCGLPYDPFTAGIILVKAHHSAMRNREP